MKNVTDLDWVRYEESFWIKYEENFIKESFGWNIWTADFKFIYWPIMYLILSDNFAGRF